MPTPTHHGQVAPWSLLGSLLRRGRRLGMHALMRSCSCLCLCLCLGLVACPEDPRLAQPTAVATVGDGEIGAHELLAALAQRGTARLPEPAARAAVAGILLDEMVTERLLLKAAADAGITVPHEDVEREVRSRAESYPPGSFQRLLVAEQLTFAEFKDRVHRRLTQDALLRARLGPPAPVEEDALRARHEVGRGHAPRTVGEQVRARQILVRTAEEAAHILRQLRARTLGFEAAAQRFSTSPDAAGGGDLGWFARGEMPEVFEVCFNLDPGTVSDVVISDYGFHIFQVIDRREARVEGFEDARERLAREIARERQESAYRALLVELRARTPVTIHHDVVQGVLALLPPPPVVPAPHVEPSVQALDSHAAPLGASSAAPRAAPPAPAPGAAQAAAHEHPGRDPLP